MKSVTFAAVLLATAGIASASANSITTGYDINRFLNEGHPLANRMGTKWKPAVQPRQNPTYQAPRSAAPVTNNSRQALSQPAQKPLAQPRANPNPNTAQQVRQTTPASQPVETARASTGWSEKSARASSRGKPLGGIISEISIGALMHDQGPFSNNKEDGIDAHIEVRFKSPDFLDIIWSPEPHIGANINSEGDTSQVFVGLSYEWLIWKGLFAGISFGAAYHDGETDSHLPDKKDLGCSLLFRESLTLGWQITDNHKIAGVFDHISNAKICDFNEGLENLGVRYSYRF